MITVNTKSGTTVITTSGSLLESLERADIKVNSQCRKGFCGACRVNLTKGEVEYFTEPLGFIRNNEVLPCCCKPKPNSNIELEINA